MSDDWDDFSDTTVPDIPMSLRVDVSRSEATSPCGRFDDEDLAKFGRQHRDAVTVGQFGLLLDLVTPEEIIQPPPDAA